MRLVLPFLALIALAFPAPAIAQVQVADSGDTAWMMICAALILFAAIPGLALRFAGAVPASDASAAMARVVMAATIAALLWAAIGNMLAFAPGPVWFGELHRISPENMTALRPGMTIPEISFIFFQLSVATMACSLLTGAFAGYRLLPVTLLSMLWLLLVYVPVVRAVSAGGWLAQSGVADFSGAFALHLATGVSALTAAVMLRLRRSSGGYAPGAPVLGVTGCALVWLGSLGLSGGWTFGATADAVAAILNTHLAACAGVLGWAVIERVRTGHATAVGMGCGALTGLAAISACAGFTDMPGAILTGLCAGVLGQFASAITRVLRADDPANIFAVHATGGATGAFMLVLVNSRFQADILLVNQAVGVGAVIVWSAAVTALLTLPLMLLNPARSV